MSDDPASAERPSFTTFWRRGKQPKKDFIPQDREEEEPVEQQYSAADTGTLPIFKPVSYRFVLLIPAVALIPHCRVICHGASASHILNSTRAREGGGFLRL